MEFVKFKSLTAELTYSGVVPTGVNVTKVEVCDNVSLHDIIAFIDNLNYVLFLRSR